MAQILESRGTFVTVSLLEGNPEELTNWAKTLISNDNYIEKLYTKFSLSSNEVKINLNKIMSEFSIVIRYLECFI